MLWLVAAGALFLAKVTKGRKYVYWLIPVGLLFIGVCALVWAPIPWTGQTVASLGGRLLAYPLGWLGDLVNAGVGPMATVAIVVLLIAGFLDLLDRVPDNYVKTAIVVVPILAVIAVGPVANSVQHVTRVVSGRSTTVVSGITH